MNRKLFAVLIFSAFYFYGMQVSAQNILFNTWDILKTPGWIFGSDFGYSPSIDLQTDTPNPEGTVRFIFPAGFKDGYSPAVASYDFNDQQEIWFGFWFKFSANWQWHPITNKLVYVSNGHDSRNGNWPVMVDGSQKLWMVNQISWGPGTQSFLPNTGINPTIQPGRWYWLEVHAKQNTPGVSNGLIEVWLDGQLVINHNNVPYRSAAQSNLGFGKFSLNPIWGGLAGATKKQEDRIWYDYTVLSTTPIGVPTSLTIPLPPRQLQVR